MCDLTNEFLNLRRIKPFSLYLQNSLSSQPGRYHRIAVDGSLALPMCTVSVKSMKFESFNLKSKIVGRDARNGMIRYRIRRPFDAKAMTFHPPPCLVSNYSESGPT
ncbi:hypothetical protein EVAR_61429_1 [Eumeta japonica]|uniref:Uncharacterized protein n=1 Tax=Eumeta variegata TaxID=151549 RepID=A0A4C1Y6G6_EUMVA|nr:hypothetical protein EVAR_61429_1 [Eumeta japonica]